MSPWKVRLIGEGNMEGGSYTGDFERWRKEGFGNEASPFVGALWGNLQTTKDMPSKALEMDVCFNRGPILGEHGGDAPFIRSSREGRNWFFYWEKCYWGILEKCKRRLWKRVTLSTGAPAGERGGGSFTRTFERQMEGSGNWVSLINLIWGLFWAQIMLGTGVLGQSGTSVRDNGSHDLASQYEAQRGYFKIQVHWDRKGSNPVTTLTRLTAVYPKRRVPA
jgi:hypothetical protein